jgi:hypothetical protein
MIHHESYSNIEQAIANVVILLKEIDDRILHEKNEIRLNEMKATRELFIQALDKLSAHAEVN